MLRILHAQKRFPYSNNVQIFGKKNYRRGGHLTIAHRAGLVTKCRKGSYYVHLHPRHSHHTPQPKCSCLKAQPTMISTTHLTYTLNICEEA